MLYVFFLAAVVRGMTVTFHSHDPFTSSVRCAAGMWDCYAGCWQIRYTCPCPWTLFDGWLPWEWRRNVSTLLTGCSLTFFFFFIQVGVHLRERIPVHRHGGELRLQQNERSGLHQRERERKGLGCRRLRLPFPGLLSARAFQGRWNVDRVCHTTPNWSVLCFPSAASHRPPLTGLW